MIWIIIAIIVVLVIFVIASYNGLVNSRMQTKERGVKLMFNWNVVMTFFLTWLKLLKVMQNTKVQRLKK